MHSRRKFLLSLAATGLLLPSSLLANEINEPFRRVGPNIAEKGQIVAFFQFTCAACAASHELIANWGASLPQGLSFRFSPIVYLNRHSVAAAQAWLAIGKFGRKKQLAFELAAYDLIQRQRKSEEDPATWVTAVISAGVNKDKFLQAVQQVELADINALGEIVVRNEIRETPSILFDGKLIVTPNSVEGDRALFLQLLNGMASAMLEGRTV